MPRVKKEPAEQIIPSAASFEVEVGRGKRVPMAVKKIGVTEQTYSCKEEAVRWPPKKTLAKRLKDLEKENSRL